MRNTKQKNLIYSIVNSSNSHLDAYHIYEICRNKIPNISLGTVYRNLSNLVSEGKIIKINVNGFDRYDKNIKHAHFVCSNCKDIIDICDDILINKDSIEGNLVVDYEIKIKGICKKCIRKEEIVNGIKRK